MPRPTPTTTTRAVRAARRGFLSRGFARGRVADARRGPIALSRQCAQDECRRAGTAVQRARRGMGGIGSRKRTRSIACWNSSSGRGRRNRCPTSGCCSRRSRRRGSISSPRRRPKLGAAVIQPVITARTVVTRLKDERLQANAVEAAEQCGLVAVPAVREAAKLVGAARALERGRAGGGSSRRRRARPARRGEPAAGAAGGCGRRSHGRMLVGPEGGFSPEERDATARLARATRRCCRSGPGSCARTRRAIAALDGVSGWCVGDW